MTIQTDTTSRTNRHIETPEPTAADISRLLDKVHNADCLDLMRSMPDECVGMVFADPPFNLNKKYSSYNDNRPFNEYMAWTAQWLAEACRILKPDGSVFVYNIPKLLTHTAPILNELAEFRHWIAWNSNGQPLGKTMQPAHYGILFYTKNRKSKFYDVRARRTRPAASATPTSKTTAAKSACATSSATKSAMCGTTYTESATAPSASIRTPASSPST